MEERRHSPTSEAPEAVHPTQATFGFVGSDDYEYYEPPPSAHERQRSPVPAYQQYDNSPRISAQSPPPPSSDIGRSPQISEGGFSKTRPLSPSAQYSEIHSPDPERAYDDPDGEKEAVYTPPAHHSKVPSYYAGSGPIPGIHHQNSGDKPQLWSADNQVGQEQPQKKKKPFYKRWIFIIGVIALIVIIAVAVPVGVVFGRKKSGGDKNTDNGAGIPAGNGTSPNNPNVDIQTSIGGQINDAYYSKSGAFNGSGVAIAAANAEYNQAIYSFYQDYEGAIQYKLYDPSGKWNLVGPVNNDSPKALNGTPLSTVQHAIGDELVWHLFYIDEDYYVRERIITNKSSTGPSPIWTDGPLSTLDLKAWQSNSIGLQACYWGNYYGQWSYNATQISAGIHIWYASEATVFQEYSWTNGTQQWNHDQQWNDLSGNAGVGCQTWYNMVENVWFVNTKNEIEMYWKDNNQSGTATPDHPINEWTPVNIDIKDVQIDSSLGFTNYMVWQDQDGSIKGANITFNAENTTIATGKDPNGKDTFTLPDGGGENVSAVLGTHLSITAVKTPSGGAQLQVFFQETGNDVSMYTRDATQYGGLWQPAAQNPVVGTS